MTRKQIKQYYLIYTGIAAVMLLITYAPFAAAGKTLIFHEDGLNQHCRALIYYSEWLREIGRTLVTEHRLVVPEWDFSIGYGSNILTTLNYYVIGDPLNLLSAFVPGKYMSYFYSFLVLFRNYLAGMAFSAFCIYRKKKCPVAVLAGAVTYMLCGYAMYAGTMHAFFLNPMIYFPLVLLGVEKVMHKEKAYMLIFSVFISAISNFYFFYMIVLLTVVYVLVRCICTYGWKRRKDGMLAILKIGLFAFVGVLLSAAVFLPVAMAFLQDYRIVKEYVIDLFYGPKYYGRMPVSFVSGISMGNYSVLGYGVPALLAVVLLFAGENRKKYRAELKILFVIGTIFLLFPVIGHIFNGFSYTSNRWVWGYSMLCAFILCDVWEELTAMRPRNSKLLIGVLACYAVILVSAAVLAEKMWKYNGSDGLFALLYFGAVTVLLAACLWKKGKQSRRAVQGIMLLLVFAEMTQNAYEMFEKRGIRKTYFSAAEVNAFYADRTEKLVQSLQEKSEGFFRYGEHTSKDNAPVNAGTHGMNYYWSLSNGNISKFMVNTQAYVMRLYHYRNLDERTILTALTGSRYYICRVGENQRVPYGYRKTDEQDGYVIYENEYALPLGYCYDSFVTESEAAVWNGAQREEAMAQTVILDTEAVPGVSSSADADGKARQGAEPAEYKNGQPDFAGREIALHAAEMSKGVTESEQGFTVKKKGATAVLEAEELCGKGEYYFCMEGFEYQGKKDKIYLTVSAVTDSGRQVSRRMFYETKKSKWPSGIKDFTLNLGCGEESVKTITITFPAKGKYNFDRLYLWHQPLANYEQQMDALRKDHLVNEQMETNRVSGDITLAEAKILCLSIPYDGGWTAYVDGKKQTLLKANYMFSALMLPEGGHHIELRYRTPGLNAGLLLSLAGALILLGIVRYNRRMSVRK